MKAELIPDIYNERDQNNDEDDQIFNYVCPPTTNFQIKFCCPTLNHTWAMLNVEPCKGLERLHGLKMTTVL